MRISEHVSTLKSINKGNNYISKEIYPRCFISVFYQKLAFIFVVSSERIKVASLRI